jgi:hypothetical protein
MATTPFDIYLVNGNITLFLGAHTDNFKNDILNSSLLGELASISKHSDNREMLWSGFVDTVSKIGWITKSREFKRYEFSTKSLLKIVESNTANVLTKEDRQALLNAFLHLKKPASQSPVTQVMIDRLQANTFACDETECIASARAPVASSTRMTIVRSNASIITLQVVFKTTHGISTDILDQPVLDAIRDGKPNAWLLVSALDARQYDNLRATVIKKIGNHIRTDLLHVPTPNHLA